jgi:hypothetical protein
MCCLRVWCTALTPTAVRACGRRYALQDWPGEPSPAATWATYRGPHLAAVMEHQWQGLPSPPGPGALLAVVDVPGLPEHRPLLVAGDALYFRLADHASEEYAGARLWLYRCGLVCAAADTAVLRAHLVLLSSHCTAPLPPPHTHTHTPHPPNPPIPPGTRPPH